MKFKHPQYFLQIVKYGSISKAAEALFLSQPSLSKYLRTLEESLGETLFDRSRYPLQLTAAGEVYLRHLQMYLETEQSLDDALQELQPMEYGTVRIGLTVWRSSIILPMVLPDFHREHPHIQIEVSEGSHQYLANLFEHGAIDFALLHMPSAIHQVVFEHLQEERILFCVSRQHEKLAHQNLPPDPLLGSLEPSALRTFADRPCILLREGQNLRDIVQNYFQTIGFSPKSVFETSNLVTAMNLARQGYGYTFVPETVLRIPSEAHGLAFYSIGRPPLHWDLCLAYPKKKKPHPVVRLFMDFLSQKMKSGEPSQPAGQVNSRPAST